MENAPNKTSVPGNSWLRAALKRSVGCCEKAEISGWKKLTFVGVVLSTTTNSWLSGNPPRERPPKFMRVMLVLVSWKNCMVLKERGVQDWLSSCHTPPSRAGVGVKIHSCVRREIC